MSWKREDINHLRNDVGELDYFLSYHRISGVRIVGTQEFII